MSFKDGINYDGKEFTEQNAVTMNMMAGSEKSKLNDELTAEDWVNIHKYLISKMTGAQQTIVDSLLNECGREMIDVELPQSQWNWTGHMLQCHSPQADDVASRDSIEEQRNRIKVSHQYHPIFDYKARNTSMKSWNTDFHLNSFDPYQEYEYLESIIEARGVIARMVAEQGFKGYTELSGDYLDLAEQNIERIRRYGNGHLDDKYFYGYRMVNLFSDTCGAALFPSYVVGTVFVDCRFSSMSFVETRFANCLFIDCTFDSCDFRAVTFEGCEFLNTDFDDLIIHESGRIIFNHCYMHERRENSRHTQEQGDHKIQPWDDPLQITMDSKCGRNAGDTALMFTGCVGIPTNASFLNLLDHDSKGFICYKRIGKTTFPRPDRWVIKNGSFITENVNNDKLEECERGVNVSNFFFAFTQYYDSDLWVCRIRYEDVGDICVPWGSAGKFRASRVELMHKVVRWETQIKIVEREVDKWNKAKLVPRLMDEVETRHEYVCNEFITNPTFKRTNLKWWFDEPDKEE